MNNIRNKMLGSIALCVVSISPVLMSSCAVSEDRAGTTGSILGGVGGAVIGNQVTKGKITGSRSGDTALLGIGGYGVGDFLGRKSSTTTGMKRTDLPEQ